MSRWTQVVAVALAAVVGVVPVFAQLSYAQAVQVAQTAPVLPIGDEMDDAELAEVDGEVLFILKLAKVAKLAFMAGTVAATSVQKGCQRASEAVTSLTLRGVSSAEQAVMMAQQHPLATRMAGSSVASAVTTAANGGSLQDVVVAAASGALGGLAGHGVGKLPIAQQNPLPVSATTGFVTGAGFEAIYRALDPSTPVTLRDVAVAGFGGAVGSLGVDGLIDGLIIRGIRRGR